MQATIEEVKEILTYSQMRVKQLDWELQGHTEGELPADLLEVLWNHQETVALCKERLAQEAAK